MKKYIAALRLLFVTIKNLTLLQAFNAKRGDHFPMTLMDL